MPLNEYFKIDLETDEIIKSDTKPAAFRTYVFAGDDMPEMVDAMKGKEQDRGGSSRLCKLILFKRCAFVAKPISGRHLLQTLSLTALATSVLLLGFFKAVL